MVLPWQTENWQQVTRYLKDNRLAHAILLLGPTGIGKLEFCLSFIQRMNCSNPTLDDYACGGCKNCHFFIARTHPDVRLINVNDNVNRDDDRDKKPNNKVEQIKVDDIREINQFMTLSRLQGEYKIVCINYAEMMNVNAANALLKTLEEPPQNSILFLISHRIDLLLPTIKSRCQMWKFNLPEERQSLHWLAQQQRQDNWLAQLKVAGYRPLLALELLESGSGKNRANYYMDLDQYLLGKTSLTKVSAKHQDDPLEQLLIWQQSWCADLIRCCYEIQPVTLENLDIRRSLHSLVGRVDLHSVYRYMDKLIEFRRFSSTPLNKRLFIEDMLIRCQELLEQPA